MKKLFLSFILFSSFLLSQGNIPVSKISGYHSGIPSVFLENSTQTNDDIYEISSFQKYTIPNNSFRDLSGSFLTATAYDLPYENKLRIDFSVNVSTTDYNMSSGVLLTFPNTVGIDTVIAYPQLDNGFNLPNDAIVGIINQNEVVVGDTLTDGSGIISQDQIFSITVILDPLDLPINVDYTIYDDGWAQVWCVNNCETCETYNIGNDCEGNTLSDVVNVSGSLLIDQIIELEHAPGTVLFDLKNITSGELILDAQVSPGQNDIESMSVNGFRIEKGSLIYFEPGSFIDLIISSNIPSQIDSYFDNGWAYSARATDTYGSGTNDLDLLSDDYEVRWTANSWEDISFGDNGTYHMVTGGGSWAWVDGARQYSLASHPDPNNPGDGNPFRIRIPYEIWNIEDPANPYQVEITIYDRNQTLEGGGSFWAHNPNGRVYTHFLNVPYRNDSQLQPEQFLNEDVNHLTWNVVWWNSPFQNGDYLTFIYDTGVQDNDVYRFNLDVDFCNDAEGSSGVELWGQCFSLENTTEILLGNSGLSGEIPTEIGYLYNLEKLELFSNNLEGNIPSSIGSLTNLTHLWLDNNQLTGNIPTQIGELENLIELKLFNNNLSGAVPIEIGNCNNLELLSLRGNFLNGDIPAEFENLNNLFLLDLAYNELSGNIPAGLGSLTSLNVLDLDRNQLSGQIPAQIGNLVNLATLHLGSNQLSGQIPDTIGNLQNASYINLWNNQLSGTIPESLWNLVGLSRLDLDSNQLTGEISSDLGNLVNLEKLFLDNNLFSGNIPTQIGNLSNLKTLTLHNNNFDGSIPPEIGNLINLEYLYLGGAWDGSIGNSLNGTLPSELSNLTNLIHLNVQGSFNDEIGMQLTGNIPEWIGTFSNLTYLNLSGNNFAGEIPNSLWNLNNLSNLSLSENNLEGFLPSEIENLQNLEVLGLAGNHFYGSLPDEIGSLNLLEQIYLHSNNFSGELPNSLFGLNNLVQLDLAWNEFSGIIPEQICDLSVNWNEDCDGWHCFSGFENNFCPPYPSCITDQLIGNQNLDNCFALDTLASITMTNEDVYVLPSVMGDSALVAVNADLGELEIYSFEMHFNGVGEFFDEIVTNGSVLENGDWNIISNTENLGELQMSLVAYGTTPVSGQVTLFYLKFHIMDFINIETTYPIEISYVELNELEGIILTSNGSITSHPLLFGDVTMNNDVSGLDAANVLRYSIGNLEFDQYQYLVADVTMDGTISALDASGIAQYSINIIDTLPQPGGFPGQGFFNVSNELFYQPGEILEIPIELSDGSNLLSFEIEIVYDSNQVSYEEIIWSNELDHFVIEKNNQPGHLQVAGYGTTPDGQDGVFATIKMIVSESTEESIEFNIKRVRINEAEPVEDLIVSINQGILKTDDRLMPNFYALHQNYPNPFNPTTKISYDLPEESIVTLSIYDLMGRKVRTLVNSEQTIGFKNILWNATNDIGQPVPAGMYIYTIQAGEFRETRKMVLLK